MFSVRAHTPRPRASSPIHEIHGPVILTPGILLNSEPIFSKVALLVVKLVHITWPTGKYTHFEMGDGNFGRISSFDECGSVRQGSHTAQKRFL